MEKYVKTFEGLSMRYSLHNRSVYISLHWVNRKNLAIFIYSLKHLFGSVWGLFGECLSAHNDQGA